MARTHDVYLSSTLRDLTDERDAVEAVLTQQGYGVLQSYSADEQSVRDSCLADVASCAIYVGIVGLRYGHCPADPNGSASCSITELEFREARRLHKPCYVFIKSQSARTYCGTDMDSATGENERGARIAAFRALLEGGTLLRPKPFATVQELREAVLAKLPEFEDHLATTRPAAAPASSRSGELAALVQRFVGASARSVVADLIGGRLGTEELDAIAADDALSRQACAHLLAAQRVENSAWMRRLIGELLVRRPDAGVPVILGHAFGDEPHEWAQRQGLLAALRFAEGGNRAGAMGVLYQKAQQAKSVDYDTLRLVIAAFGYLGEAHAARWVADNENFDSDADAAGKLGPVLAIAGLSAFIRQEGVFHAGLGTTSAALEARRRLGKELDAVTFEETLHRLRPGLAQPLLRHAADNWSLPLASALLASLVGRLPGHAADDAVMLTEMDPQLAERGYRAIASIGDESVWAALAALAGHDSLVPPWARMLAIGWLGGAGALRRADEVSAMLAQPASFATVCALWAAGRIAAAATSVSAVSAIAPASAAAGSAFVAPLRRATADANPRQRAVAWLALAHTSEPPRVRELLRAIENASDAVEQVVLGIAGACAGHLPVVEAGLVAAERHWEPIWRLWGWGRHLYTDFEAACETRLGAPGQLMLAMLKRGHL
ncbi:MAG TPA: DUF4062 domain-containing protein [Burkholderiaceae bacterium]